MAKKIYTAGFDLFAPDAEERTAKIRALCVQYGYEPYVPKDEDAGEAPTAEAIFQKNLAHIQDCDLVVANLNPFRGAEPDCGTAWEVGYAYALGKPIHAYMSDTRTMVEKLGGTKDADGFTVENFGGPINLMLTCSASIVQGTLEDCLKSLQYIGDA